MTFKLRFECQEEPDIGRVSARKWRVLNPKEKRAKQWFTTGYFTTHGTLGHVWRYFGLFFGFFCRVVGDAPGGQWVKDCSG